MPSKTLAPEVVQKLREYDWPGNVRELYNVIQRALIFSQGRQIQLRDVSDLPVLNASSKPSSDNFRDARARVLEAFERAYIEEKLRETGGNITRASRLAKKGPARVWPSDETSQHSTQPLTEIVASTAGQLQPSPGHFRPTAAPTRNYSIRPAVRRLACRSSTPLVGP